MFEFPTLLESQLMSLEFFMKYGEPLKEKEEPFPSSLVGFQLSWPICLRVPFTDCNFVFPLFARCCYKWPSTACCCCCCMSSDPSNRLKWTNSHQCTSWGWGRWSRFGDEPKTHLPLPKVIDFFSLFSTPNFFPPTYLPFPTYLTWFCIHSIIRTQEWCQSSGAVGARVELKSG